MSYKDILIKLASMTTPYVYDDTISFLELNRKLYHVVNELILAMQGLSTDYENLKDYVDDYFKNLNLENEVQRVINQMVEDGTLGKLINEELLGEINNNIAEITSEIETINSSLTTTNDRIDDTNTNVSSLQTNLQTANKNITTLDNRGEIQLATCQENANYILNNKNFIIKENDVIYIHFNASVNKDSDATLTINDTTKNVIKEDGSLYKGSDIENKDLILKVTQAGLIQVVDIATLQEQINNIKYSLIDFFLPVGSQIYNENADFNPNTIYTGTTWAKVSGVFLIGLDENDDDFNTLGKTGGSKTHTQTLEELAPHNHGLKVNTNENATTGAGRWPWVDYEGVNRHTESAGEGQPMDIMNPYKVTNIWQRTA